MKPLPDTVLDLVPHRARQMKCTHADGHVWCSLGDQVVCSRAGCVAYFDAFPQVHTAGPLRKAPPARPPAATPPPPQPAPDRRAVLAKRRARPEVTSEELVQWLKAHPAIQALAPHWPATFRHVRIAYDCRGARGGARPGSANKKFYVVSRNKASVFAQ